MRSLPIDTTALRLLATGGVQPVAVWAELADGSRRPVPGKQETDENGTPVWVVEVLCPPAEGGERAELLSVRVASADQPKVTEFAPVQFEGLVCQVNVSRKTGQLGQYWSAAGVKAGAQHKQHQQAA